MTTGAATYTTLSRFQALLKRVYANSYGELVPDDEYVAGDIPFSARARVGDEYCFPVVLTRAAGHTHNVDGSVFQLNRPLAASQEQARLKGATIVTREAMSYDTITAAMTGTGSKEGDKRAFVEATKYQMKRLVEAAKFEREMGLLYGSGTAATIPTNANWGVVESVTDNTGTVDVVFTAASWATGIWLGTEGQQLDCYTTAGVKQNTGGTAGAADSVYSVTTVTPTTRTVRFTSAAANTAAVTAGEVFIPAGAYQKEMLGLAAVVNTSGTVWNISNSSYYLWKPKTVAVGGAKLTFEALQTGCAKAFEAGYTGELIVYMNPFTWQDIADEENSLINYAEKTGGKLEKGFDKVSFVGQNGKITLKSHRFMKQGFAYGIPKDMCYRVGTSDVTSQMPGVGEMTRELEDYAGVETRAYQNQAPFCERPGAIVEWSGIVNTRTSAS
jgi:hypothetical protein